MHAPPAVTLRKLYVNLKLLNGYSTVFIQYLINANSFMMYPVVVKKCLK